MRETFEQFLGQVETYLDEHDAVPSWTTAIHDRVVESVSESFQAGKSLIETADEAATEAWRLWNFHG